MTRKKQTAKLGRLRGVPVQVYLTDAEAEEIREIAAARGCSVSELVRRWIGRAATRGTTQGTSSTSGAHQDPRQLSITGSDR